jgi:hypothetical protein
MTDPLNEILSPRALTTRELASPICAQCRSDAAAVAYSRPHGPDDWVIGLRCGDCESWQELTVSHRAMARLEHQLIAGRHAIERDLGALERTRMVGYIETFIVALERDLIDAGDFALQGTPT